MHVQARVDNRPGSHDAEVTSDGRSQTLAIPGKPAGGSAASGGEMLFLALATCYCNDLYREAARRDVELTHVEVTVEGDFAAPGQPARAVSYRARVWAKAPREEIEALMAHTDTVAEIHNTLRQATAVTLTDAVAVAG